MSQWPGVISLGHELNLKVIAEGVETEEQLEFLHANGCDEMQGYLLSPPVPPAELPGLIKTRFGVAHARRGRHQVPQAKL